MSKCTHKKYTHNTLKISLYNKYLFVIIRVDMSRYTIKDFRNDFPDDDVCLDTIFENRYGDVKTCPGCGVIDTKFHRVTGRKCYACQWCGYQLHPLAQTIFHKSSTPLTTWFEAIYLFSNAKNGIAALELQRHFGITYKTAHRMARQIRSLMSEEGTIGGFGTPVEIDETYIGGKHKHALRHSKKSSVFGAVERGGEVRARHIQSTGARVLLPEIAKTVEAGTEIHSDEWPAYKTLGRRGYSHTTVNHSKAGVCPW